MNNTRMYIAYYGDTEFEFESEHKAGSAANLEDAYHRARVRFGKLHNTISGIHLRQEVTSAPIGHTAKVYSLTEEERAQILKGFEDGKLTRAYMGAKVDGLIAFAHIKNAHGWSWNDFQRAVEDLH